MIYMEKRNFIFVKLFVFLLLFLSATLLKSQKTSGNESCFPMIWNQGITKKSWVYLEQDEPGFYKENSDITEGDNLNMPKNNWDAVYIDNKTKKKFSTPHQTNASFKFVTTGYAANQQKGVFRFNFIVLNKNKKHNESYIFRIINNSQRESYKTYGKIKEVGFVFDNWPQYWANENKWIGGYHSLSENYQIENLDNLVVSFKFRLVAYNKPLNKKIIEKKWLGSYATCDLRFNEYDANGKVLQSYLIGLVFSNPLKVDYNGNKNDNILFESNLINTNEQKIILVHGNKNGVNEINKVSPENTFQNVEIDFKPLIMKYLNINSNHKNIITGIDIYSATRAADFTYDIKDIQVTGCKQD